MTFSLVLDLGIALAVVAALTLWLVLTTYVAMMTRWFRLARRYPDPREAPVLVLRKQTGWMGLGVHLRGVLTLGVCPSGLRVARRRLFAPFCGPFLVPWADITPRAETAHVYRGTVRFELGSPPVGNLRIDDGVAERLARAAEPHWPAAARLTEAAAADRNPRPAGEEP